MILFWFTKYELQRFWGSFVLLSDSKWEIISTYMFHFSPGFHDKQMEHTIIWDNIAIQLLNHHYGIKHKTNQEITFSCAYL